MIARSVDILIPTYNRPFALAVLLTSLIAQTFKDFSIHISDQSNNRKTDKNTELKVAWEGGCVLNDTQKLCSVGGFSFWKALPLCHASENVLLTSVAPLEKE